MEKDERGKKLKTHDTTLRFCIIWNCMIHVIFYNSVFSSLLTSAVLRSQHRTQKPRYLAVGNSVKPMKNHSHAVKNPADANRYFEMD